MRAKTKVRQSEVVIWALGIGFILGVLVTVHLMGAAK